ncbi:MAG: hypothetical protein ACLU9S_17460 [Oscillospiraceae bacterium]
MARRDVRIDAKRRRTQRSTTTGELMAMAGDGRQVAETTDLGGTAYGFFEYDVKRPCGREKPTQAGGYTEYYIIEWSASRGTTTLRPAAPGWLH